jgi:polyphosphate kinase
MTDQLEATAAPDLDDPSLYENRELSWLDFDARVLELAEDERQPLLERAKFASIFTSNLDEFFMIRVAGLEDQLEAGVTDTKADGRTPKQVLRALRERLVDLYARQARCVDEAIRPRLARCGIELLTLEDLDDDERAELQERFGRQVLPVLTPLAVGLGRPFPYISNLSLSLAVLVRDPQTHQSVFARVKVPKELLPRLFPVGGPESTRFVALEDVIAEHLGALFPGMEVVDHACFRVTRDADFEVSDEADDLLRAVEAELRRRRFGEVVRLEVSAGMSRALRDELTAALRVEDRQVYEVEGLLDLTDLMQLVKLPGFPGLRDEPWNPVTQPRLRGDDEAGDMFAELRRGDVLVHHPYESFATSVERFVTEAASDPHVLAMKMTVYRTSDDTPLMPALIRASERGKQAVCLVELKARFDERANIGWARALEQAGVHVVYGHPALKTHAKCLLVVRREGDGVRHYVHIGTGNYHPKTARLYTDFGLFTADPDLGADVADMFNFLTGFARPEPARKALLAPTHLRDGILAEIDRTIEAHREGRPARIWMKMNALVDRACIKALYRASQAGVEVRLSIRGICCLVPGVAGVSENIEVVSVVGRFLEHSRIYAFGRGDDWTVYIGSADLMPRNLDTRVELVAPVEDPELRAELLEAMEVALLDDEQAWVLGADRTWTRRTPGERPRNLQRELMARHTARAAETVEPA